MVATRLRCKGRCPRNCPGPCQEHGECIVCGAPVITTFYVDHDARFDPAVAAGWMLPRECRAHKLACSPPFPPYAPHVTGDLG